MATKKAAATANVVIPPPNFQQAQFEIIGTAPLVMHRMSQKLKQEFEAKMLAGSTPAKKKTFAPANLEEIMDGARYINKSKKTDTWDGIHAAAFRNALISACRLVNFKMTIAKMSIFVVQDGWDYLEPQIPLVRIRGTQAVMQQDIARTQTGVAYLCIRPAYHGWSAKLNLRWDGDQFKLADVANLLNRAGQQVGVGEGRPDSKNSAGMGWGTFMIKEA